MDWFRKLKDWLLTPYYRYQNRKFIEKRRKEMQEQDPYIYK